MHLGLYILNEEIVLSVYLSQIKLEDDLKVNVFQPSSIFHLIRSIDLASRLHYADNRNTIADLSLSAS